jgi:hypothetical protein
MRESDEEQGIRRSVCRLLPPLPCGTARYNSMAECDVWGEHSVCLTRPISLCVACQE